MTDKMSDEQERGREIADPKVLVALIEVLQPHTDTIRIRSVESALKFLGTDWCSKATTTPSSGPPPKDPEVTSAPPRRAAVWLAQNKLDDEMLNSVFHRTPTGVELIVHELPAHSNKERVQQCYLLCGVRALLSTGEPKFSDEDARATCRELGCYDRDNHANYVKATGNLLAGSKSAGFELTQPGLRIAADVIRKMKQPVVN